MCCAYLHCFLTQRQPDSSYAHITIYMGEEATGIMFWGGTAWLSDMGVRLVPWTAADGHTGKSSLGPDEHRRTWDGPLYFYACR